MGHTECQSPWGPATLMLRYLWRNQCFGLRVVGWTGQGLGGRAPDRGGCTLAAVSDERLADVRETWTCHTSPPSLFITAVKLCLQRDTLLITSHQNVKCCHFWHRERHACVCVFGYSAPLWSCGYCLNIFLTDHWPLTEHGPKSLNPLELAFFFFFTSYWARRALQTQW